MEVLRPSTLYTPIELPTLPEVAALAAAVQLGLRVDGNAVSEVDTVG